MTKLTRSLAVCAFALVAAFGALASAPPAAAAFGLPPALVGFPYKGCLGEGPAPGSAQYYARGGIPSNTTMGTRDDNFWCLVSESPHERGVGHFNFDVEIHCGTRGMPETYYLCDTTSASVTVHEAKFIVEGPTTGQVGVPFATQLQTYTNPGGDHGWVSSVVSGSLPPGLSLSGNGIVTGTPTQAGTFTFTTRSDSGSFAWQSSARPTHTWTITIAQAPAPALVISTASLPAAVAYDDYNQPLLASNGRAPYTWDLVGGALPPGLTIAPTGAVRGTPTKAGQYEFTVRARDARGASAVKGYVLNVTWPELEFKPAALRAAVIGKRYVARIFAEGGRNPYKFELKRGNLPTGLLLAQNGVIRGIPKKGPARTYRFVVAVVDVNGAPGEATYSIKLKKPPPKKRRR